MMKPTILVLTPVRMKPTPDASDSITMPCTWCGELCWVTPDNTAEREMLALCLACTRQHWQLMKKSVRE